MKPQEILEVKTAIKHAIRRGDYVVLGKMLSKTTDAARMRYNRNKADAVLAMKKIVEDRAKTIEGYIHDSANTTNN
ncbi:hypothetical protein [Pseudotamlana carrageenivorans]|uniref:Uncharacterized protein n=1 Tax=Pseudotamlana carrageenivorans TaxID=2069432 RepID=A0A2I7SF42_9FLAO|nr:hypothetical protein [Tamlana carrageenivorans]AUS04521.1 hypothetical protein C1A40_03095 [Tamlana carrageenivorans]